MANIELTFMGAAGNVTGSRYLISWKSHKILIDCGLFQEWKHKDRNYDPFAVSPKELDAVLLTHAHLDHCGLLPKLVKEGYTNPVYATPPSIRIADIVMQDAARIQEEDTAYKNRRHEKEQRDEPKRIPLYTVEDAEQTRNLLRSVPFKCSQEIVPGCHATWYEAGHILGAASILIDIEGTRILFSGDIGRDGAPLLRDPHRFTECDYLIVESTYGNRVHEPTYDIEPKLAKVINDTRQRGGNILIPSFAVERSQDLLLHLSTLLHQHQIPPLKVYMDSPMAIRVTEVFKQFPNMLDAETQKLMDQGITPCDFPTLELCRTVMQSKSINEIRGTSIIIAGSGMCTGGRIKHHLNNNLHREESTVLFIGYQAEGTLGRQLLEGKTPVRLFGKMRDVRCNIEKINGFSGHADKQELKAWCQSLKHPPQHTYITHGEPEAALGLKNILLQELNFPCSIPSYQETVSLPSR